MMTVQRLDGILGEIEQSANYGLLSSTPVGYLRHGSVRDQRPMARRWTYQETERAPVGWLIQQRVAVDYVCSGCGLFGHADLDAIHSAKGDDFPMMDFLALCRRAECDGLLRFQTVRGIRRDWLLSSAGRAKVDAHADMVRAAASYRARKDRLLKRLAGAAAKSFV